MGLLSIEADPIDMPFLHGRSSGAARGRFEGLDLAIEDLVLSNMTASD